MKKVHFAIFLLIALCAAGTYGQDWTQPGSTSPTFSDYQDIPIDAALDSTLGGPFAAKAIGGAVGSAMSAAAANISYGTFTINADGIDITSAVWGSGTQTGKITISGLTVGQVYQLQFMPTVTGQAPTLSVTSGVAQNSPLVGIVSAIQQQVYFVPSATSVVFTFSNTATSSWSTASTGCYSYTPPVTVRDFQNSVMQSCIFPWLPPKDWGAGTITVTPYFNFDAATPPTNSQTTVWQFEGYCIVDPSNQAQAFGTSQTSTYTSGSGAVQYQWAIGPATSPITLPGAAAGAKCFIKADRLTLGSYAQNVGLANILVKFSRTVAQ